MWVVKKARQWVGSTVESWAGLKDLKKVVGKDLRSVV